MKKNCVILKWNPAISSYSMWHFLDNIYWGEVDSNWSIYDYKNVKKHDQFFMLKVGLGTCGIVSAGTITSNPIQGEDWSGQGRKIYYANYECDLMVNPETLPIISTTCLLEKIPSFDWTGGHAGVILNNQEAQVLEDIFNLYLKDNSKIFGDRLDLIKRRHIQNDQLYLSDKILEKIDSK